MGRAAAAERTTTETTVRASVDLDGHGRSDVDTGIGFLDHLLELFARHSLIDLELTARGDVHVDAHHTVEDCGIVVGRAVGEALGERAGIRRFGHAVVPMDEARASCAIDVSGRPFTAFEGSFPAERVADFDTDLAEEFLRAVANTAKLTVHLRVEAGDNAHHMVEASFKAFARALREAVSEDPRVQGVPSTKGLL
jgi:imidazoleglycerol-phosphate dehydratase